MSKRAPPLAPSSRTRPPPRADSDRTNATYSTPEAQKRVIGKDFQSQYDLILNSKDGQTGMDRSDKACQAKVLSVPKSLDSRHRQPLIRFLRRVAEMVIEQVELNLVCETEKSAEVTWLPLSDTTEVVLSLETPGSFEDVHCIDLQWNSTCTLLAGTYGSKHHDGFCSHKGGVAVWKANNIEFRKTNSDPDFLFETDTCMTASAFHPQRANLLASVSRSGGIFLWDLASTPAILTGESGMKVTGGHSEIVTCMKWITTDAKKRTFMLLTCGLDGKLVVWTNSKTQKGDVAGRTLIVPHKYALIENKPGFEESTATASGITAVSVRTDSDKESFLIGTDTGAINACSYGRFRDIKSHVSETAATFRYSSHNGPTTSLAYSPLSERCFATASTDATIKLFRTTTIKAILVTTAKEGKVDCIDWSPIRPFVLAAAGEKGKLLYYDLSSNRFEPSKTVEVFEDQTEIHAIRFNALDPEYIAIAGVKGVQIWRVPETLSKAKGNEKEQFQKFMTPKL